MSAGEYQAEVHACGRHVLCVLSRVEAVHAAWRPGAPAPEEAGVKPSVPSEGLVWNWESILGIVPMTHQVVKWPLGRDL